MSTLARGIAGPVLPDSSDLLVLVASPLRLVRPSFEEFVARPALPGSSVLLAVSPSRLARPSLEEVVARLEELCE